MFSWRSDSIDPCIFVASNTSVTWIGVDERAGALGSDSSILCAIDLDTPLQTILGFQGGVVVVFQLGAIVFDHSANQVQAVDFPDIAADTTIRGSILDVQFMDGSSMSFSLVS